MVTSASIRGHPKLDFEHTVTPPRTEVCLMFVPWETTVAKNQSRSIVRSECAHKLCKNLL